MAYQEGMEKRGEPFFVKNLENVQGDERDVVFISGTYGSDATGAQHQRFGPITGANGHRRLNVLFTRAKNRVVVFSSLDPDRIRTQGGSRGIKVLKEYLSFAKTGLLPETDGDGGTPTNDFERSVGGLLESRGHDVAYAMTRDRTQVQSCVRRAAERDAAGRLASDMGRPAMLDDAAFPAIQGEEGWILWV